MGNRRWTALRGKPQLLLLAALLWLALVAGAQATEQKPGAPANGNRVALVIGNGDYASVGRLANPRNDAKLVAWKLKESGFRLIGGNAQLDLDKSRFDRAVADFGRAIVGADVALFYYSGHGLQVNGVNYLVPVDANPTRPQDLDFQMVSADLVLHQMTGAGTKLNIIVLDACRNNPFEGVGLRSTTGGLAEMKAPEGTLISYATQPGSVARDGAGQDSPFTQALVDAIGLPGMEMFQLFNRVGVEVKKTTGGAQQPWFSASPIEGEFYFSAAPSAPAARPAVEAPLPQTAAAATGTDDVKKVAPGKPSGVISGRPAPDQFASLTPPPAPLPPAQPAPMLAAARPPGPFHCPAKNTLVIMEDEQFDWNGDSVKVRNVTDGYSWRSFGSDPASPNLCLRSGKDGTMHRLLGWFDMDGDEFSSSPEQPILALLQGHGTEATVRWSHRAAAGTTPVTFETHWRLRGHESFAIGGHAYDTLVFDLTEASTHNPGNGIGRVWYAPELGVFVRKIWRTWKSAEVDGQSVVRISTNGAGNGGATAANGQ